MNRIFSVVDGEIGGREQPAPSEKTLLDYLDNYYISQMVIRYAKLPFCNYQYGNEFVGTICQKSPERLIGCFRIDPFENFQLATKFQINCFEFTPNVANGFFFLPWCCGNILEHIVSQRQLLFLEYALIDWEHLKSVCENFPDLRVIIYKIPRIGRIAVLESMLRLFKNLHVVFAPSFSVHGDYYKYLCEQYGSHRFLFGSQYPYSSVGASISGILYSSLTEEQVTDISCRNFQRLIAEGKTNGSI